jgi:hypothetical protein
MSLRSTLVLTLTAAVLFGGCTKKDKQAQTDEDFSQAPALSEPDTADIFNEFYDEQAGSSESAPAAKNTPSSPAAKPNNSTPGASTQNLPTAQGQFEGNGKFTIQLATISSRKQADKVVAQLQAKGYPAYMAEVQNPTPDLMGSFFRVRIGFFSGVSGAKRFAEESLVPAGYEYWIDNRSNDNVGIQGEGFGQSDGSAYSSSETSSSPAASTQNQDYSGSTTGTTSSTPAASSTSSSNDSWGSSSTSSSSSSTSSSSTATSSSSSTPATSSSTDSPSSSSSTTDSTAPRDSSGSWGEDSWGSSDW